MTHLENTIGNRLDNFCRETARIVSPLGFIPCFRAISLDGKTVTLKVYYAKEQHLPVHWPQDAYIGIHFENRPDLPLCVERFPSALHSFFTAFRMAFPDIERMTLLNEEFRDSC